MRGGFKSQIQSKDIIESQIPEIANASHLNDNKTDYHNHEDSHCYVESYKENDYYDGQEC